MNKLTNYQKQLLKDRREDLKVIAIEFEKYNKSPLDYFSTPHPNTVVCDLDKKFDSFASQFEEKKDWEIMKFKHNETGDIISLRKNGLYLNDLEPECDGQYSEKLLISAGRIIHSVKYKDQVFTIGDVVEHNGKTGIITEFVISLVNGGLYVDIEYSKINSYTGAPISEVKKVERKPLFVTEDGVDVYVNDEVYQVSLVSDYSLNKMIYTKYTPLPPLYFKYFKSKEKAEEHILLNSPKLSVNEVMNIVEEEEFESTIKARLTSLVKSKSK